jgi:hypothetical protein
MVSPTAAVTVSGAKASLESSPRVTVWVAARARGRRGRRRARRSILIIAWGVSGTVERGLGFRKLVRIVWDLRDKFGLCTVTVGK